MAWKGWARAAAVGFLIGVLVPIFWTFAAFLTFGGPEGAFSRGFWRAVNITCPFWQNNGAILTGLFNGLFYTLIALAIHSFRRKS